MGQRHTNILATIGHTPVVRINKLAPPGINLYVKLESFNPMGSVKDRLALGVIEDAERRGELQPGQTIVEASSGNTGIGLAMVCAQKGYPLVIVMTENFSVERRKLMRFLGARVVLTPADKMGSGMVAKAEELAKKHGWWQPRQFDNPANAEIHARTTAVEILEDFADVSLDYWVTGFGTGGTLNGVSRVLKQNSPHTRIVVCEPDTAAMLASGMPQTHHHDGNAISHPAYHPHLMQGWAPDFIPALAAEVRAEQRYDELIAVSGQDALHYARELARQEGMFVGISAGASLAGALQIAKTAAPGSNILCMLPDTGERYLSTALFADIGSDMTEQESELSRSTPGFRFDVSSEVTATKAEPALTPDAMAQQDIEAMVHNAHQPVVIFAYEWCEFCDAARKALANYGVACHSIDLDSAAYQPEERGRKLFDALQFKTGSVTLPQIFIGGEFFGGCLDLFENIQSGQFHRHLEKNQVPYSASVKFDAYTLLPGWLLPRK